MTCFEMLKKVGLHKSCCELEQVKIMVFSSLRAMKAVISDRGVVNR